MNEQNQINIRSTVRGSKLAKKRDVAEQLDQRLLDLILAEVGAGQVHQHLLCGRETASTPARQTVSQTGEHRSKDAIS